MLRVKKWQAQKKIKDYYNRYTQLMNTINEQDKVCKSIELRWVQQQLQKLKDEISTEMKTSKLFAKLMNEKFINMETVESKIKQMELQVKHNENIERIEELEEKVVKYRCDIEFLKRLNLSEKRSSSIKIEEANDLFE